MYRFEAIKDGRIVNTLVKKPMTEMHMDVTVSHRELLEHHSYDVAEVRICMRDENENQLFFADDPVSVKTEGPIAVIGPKTIPVRGGMTGIYVKSLGLEGEAKLFLHCGEAEPVEISFTVKTTGNLY